MFIYFNLVCIFIFKLKTNSILHGPWEEQLNGRFICPIHPIRNYGVILSSSMATIIHQHGVRIPPHYLQPRRKCFFHGVARTAVQKCLLWIRIMGLTGAQDDKSAVPKLQINVRLWSILTTNTTSHGEVMII